MTDLDLAGRRVLIREDLNVPIAGGAVTSDGRIRAALPTLQHALDHGARVLVMSHLGRPDEGVYSDEPGTLQLKGAVILNAVKCLPPGNKPTPEEIATCGHYLEASLATLTKVRVVVALGQIAHMAAARTMGLWPKAKFAHGAEATGPDGRVLLSSYHPSRQNTNTGKIDAAMFESVFERALEFKCLR